MSLILTAFIDRLKHTAFEKKISASHCSIKIEKWIKYIYEEHNKCCDKSNRKAMQFRLIKPIIYILKMENFRLKKDDDEKIGIKKLCDLITEYLKQPKDVWMNAEACFWSIHIISESLRRALIDEQMPAFIEILKAEAIKEGVYNAAIVVHYYSWLDYLMFEKNDWIHGDVNGEDEEEMLKLTDGEKDARTKNCLLIQLHEYIGDMYDIQRAFTWTHLLSMETFIDELKEATASDLSNFTSWSHEEQMHGARILVATFKTATTRCSYLDILMEQFNCPRKYDHLTVKAWHEAYFKLWSPDISEDFLRKRIDQMEEEYQKYRIKYIYGRHALMEDDEEHIVKLEPVPEY